MYKMYAPPLLSINRNSFHGVTTLSIYQMTLSMSTVRSESFVYLCMLLLSTGLNEVPFRYGAAYFDSIFVPSLGYLQVLNGSTNVYFWNQNPGSSYKSCSNTHFRQRWLTAGDMCAAGYHDPYDCNSGMGRAVMQSVAYLQEPPPPTYKNIWLGKLPHVSAIFALTCKLGMFSHGRLDWIEHRRRMFRPSFEHVNTASIVSP